jgi:lysozyme family protein
MLTYYNYTGNWGLATVRSEETISKDAFTELRRLPEREDSESFEEWSQKVNLVIDQNKIAVELRKLENDRKGLFERIGPVATLFGAIVAAIALIIGDIILRYKDTDVARFNRESEIVLQATKDVDRNRALSNLDFYITIGYLTEHVPEIREQIRQGNAPFTGTSLEGEYESLFKYMNIRDEYLPTLDRIIDTIKNNISKYKSVQAKTGVPWYVVAIDHWISSSGDFASYLDNGDKLTARTIHVPAGRPTIGEPPFTWEQGAIDSIQFEKLDSVKEWNISRFLYAFESLNGFGYRIKGLASPFLWACTNLYTKGKYIADGVFDANAVSRECGAASLLKRMIDLHLISIDESGLLSSVL